MCQARNQKGKAGSFKAALRYFAPSLLHSSIHTRINSTHTYPFSSFYEVRFFKREEALYDRQVQTSSSRLNQPARLAPATRFACNLQPQPLGLPQPPETIIIGAVRAHTPPEFHIPPRYTLSQHRQRRVIIHTPSIAILSRIQCARYLHRFDLVVATTLQSF